MKDNEEKTMAKDKKLKEERVWVSTPSVTAENVQYSAVVQLGRASSFLQV